MLPVNEHRTTLARITKIDLPHLLDRQSRSIRPTSFGKSGAIHASMEGRLLTDQLSQTTFAERQDPWTNSGQAPGNKPKVIPNDETGSIRVPWEWDFGD